MKSEYFKNRSQTSQLKGKREKPIPKQVNWDRIVYFLLLFIVLGVLFYYLFNRSFYVSGEGMVVIEVTDIRAPADIEVEELFVTENSVVEKGEPLFSYSFLNWMDTVDEIKETESILADQQEELQDVENELTLQRVTIQEIEKRIEFLGQQRDDFIEKVRLNAATSYELNEVEHLLFSAKSNLRAANSELQVLLNSRNRKIQRRESTEALLTNLQSGEGSIHTFYSPLDGSIDNILVREDMQVFKADHILRIQPNSAAVYIYAVVEREDAEHTAVGTVIKIEFDDGSESSGVVRRSYDAREDVIDHFRQTGYLTNNFLVLELTAPDSATRADWAGRNRDGLSVYKNKFIDHNHGAEHSTYDSREEPALKDTETDTTALAGASTTNRSEAETADSTADRPTDVQISESDTRNADYGLMGSQFYQNLSGYTINVYSLEDQQRANRLRDHFTEDGYRATSSYDTVHGKEVWRVTLGQFRTIEDAESATRELPDGIDDNYFIRRFN